MAPAKQTRRGKVVSVNISASKGQKKKPTDCAIVRHGFGIIGDAHAGDWHRQISFLAEESIDRMRAKGLELNPGDFAENITTRGLVLFDLPLGSHIRINDVLMEVTQIGKECHDGCAIKKLSGECVMPKEGIFCRVLERGRICPGDKIEVTLC